jgi:hypothetical protein
MTESDAARLLFLMRSQWPDTVISKETTKMWAIVLGDVPYESIELAFYAHCRTSKWAPKPAELLELIAEATVGGESWESAWDELMLAVRRYGSYLFAFDKPPATWTGWSTPEVEAAVRHIGYLEVCQSEIDQLGVLRAQFRDAYRNAQQRRIKEAQLGGVADALRSLPRPDRAVATPAPEGAPQPIGAVIESMRRASS